MADNNSGRTRQRKGPQRDPIIQLGKLIGQRVHITFIGKLAIEGTLTGYDSLMNLVLTDVVETDSPSAETEGLQKYKKVVVKGQMLATLEPAAGGERIELEQDEPLI